jgi:hypothetical protein
MERIAKEGMWLTKTPQNKRNRKFYTKISGTPASLDTFEEVTDKFKTDYEKWLADEYKKDVEKEEEE